MFKRTKRCRSTSVPGLYLLTYTFLLQLHITQGSTNMQCPSMGAAWCASCDAGYTLQTPSDGAYSCALNECSCPNGVGAQGGDCAAMGQVHCTSCNEGFGLFVGAAYDGRPSCQTLSNIAAYAAML